MKIDLEVTLAQEYFNKEGKVIDYDKVGGDNKVSTQQADALQKILTSEVSIHLLRRSTGICGSLADDMIRIRKEYQLNYARYFGKYIQYNDYYY